MSPENALDGGQTAGNQSSYPQKLLHFVHCPDWSVDMIREAHGTGKFFCGLCRITVL